MSARADAFPSLRIVAHPLVATQLARLRDRRTDTAGFRSALRTLTRVMACELTSGLETRTGRVATPGGHAAPARRIAAERVAAVAILRAGLGMLAPVLELLPGAAVGLLGIERRGARCHPRVYLERLPPDRGGPVLLLDPMIATGGSAVRALDLLKRRGVPDERIRICAVVAAPEGMRRLTRAHPRVPVFAAALDAGLDTRLEIVPGLGDAGDRLFATLARPKAR